jgi:uncharacterized membrane protein YvbJ
VSYCPNCSSSLPLDAVECAECGASFREGSGWRPTQTAKPRPPASNRGFVIFVIVLMASPLLAYPLAELLTAMNGSPTDAVYFLAFAFTLGWIVSIPLGIALLLLRWAYLRSGSRSEA